MKEPIEDMDDWLSLPDEIIREFFESVKSKEKYKLYKRRIVPSMYNKALEDFMKFGTVTNYPTKYIYKWKEYVLYNIAMLRAFTDIYGHSNNCPYELFNDVFHYNQETGETKEVVKDYEEFCNQLWELCSDDDSPQWSNGHWFMSDYGLPILEKLALKLVQTQCATQILILINRILDVTHPRSDLAELFIVGGSKSLTEISN